MSDSNSDNPIQQYVTSLLNRIPKLQAILVTDKDGVVLVKAVTEALSTQQLDTSFTASFTQAAEQAGKLNIGENKYIASLYDNYELLHYNLYPIVVTFIAQNDSNLGLIIASLPQMAQVLEHIRQQVAVHIQAQQQQE